MDLQKEPLVTPLYEGTFSVGTDKKFIRIGRRDQAARGALKLAINPFLIRTGDRNILFDAGLGDFGEDTSTEVILNNLSRFDLTERDITDIFASHLHYDHLGGLAGWSDGYLSLTFPDARLWVNGNEWEKLIRNDGATDDETRMDFIHFLDARADLHFLKDEDRPLPEIRVREIGGHTEFSQALFFEKEDHRYLMAGDVIGKAGSVKRKFAAKYDFDPAKSMARREELKELAFRDQYVIMAYHEPETPLFRLASSGSAAGSYKTEDAAVHAGPEKH